MSIKDRRHGLSIYHRYCVQSSTLHSLSLSVANGYKSSITAINQADLHSTVPICSSFFSRSINYNLSRLNSCFHAQSHALTTVCTRLLVIACSTCTCNCCATVIYRRDLVLSSARSVLGPAKLFIFAFIPPPEFRLSSGDSGELSRSTSHALRCFGEPFRTGYTSLRREVIAVL